MPRRESTLDKDIMALIRERGGWCVKTHGSAYMPSGTLAILACIDAVFYGIDDKLQDGRLSVIQEQTLHKIGDAGGIALVARSIEDVRRTLDNLAPQSTLESACPGKRKPSWQYEAWKTGNIPGLQVVHPRPLEDGDPSI